MVEAFTSILEVKGLNFTNGVFVNSGKLIEYFLCNFLK
jgi:hypothetical protein